MSKNVISYKQELIRKSIHLLSLIMPLVYYFQTKEFVLSVLIPITLISITLDYLSKEGQILHKTFIKYFGSMMREHELHKKYTVNGASWVFISSVFVFLIFPKIIALTVFTILILSDTIAALIGRKYGNHKLFTKSWEGTIAFIFSACLIVIFWGKIVNAPIVFYYFGFLGATLSGFIEAASAVLKMDDNFSIPISAGLVLWLGELYANSQGQSFINLI